MKIQGGVSQSSGNQQEQIGDLKNQRGQKKAGTHKQQEPIDIYSPKGQLQSVGTYQKPKNVDDKTIERLMTESEEAYRELKEIVIRLLERQGLSYLDWISQSDEADQQVEVDGIAANEAQSLIAEGGPLSPEAVSDRIVEAARAYSGGDKIKLDQMRNAIDAGFKAAANVFGGQLPDICTNTYNLIMDKLDVWENEQ